MNIKYYNNTSNNIMGAINMDNIKHITIEIKEDSEIIMSLFCDDIKVLECERRMIEEILNDLKDDEKAIKLYNYAIEKEEYKELINSNGIDSFKEFMKSINLDSIIRMIKVQGVQGYIKLIEKGTSISELMNMELLYYLIATAYYWNIRFEKTN